MSLSSSYCSKEEWEMEDMFVLPGVEQSYQKTPFSHTFY